ncbi:hypothetical protein [Staphylococcus intermedius]|uniref:Membrane protein n=1 Tax=Staphylococcus intermedius NCTC 11048 TaxID=1141106 RepID=A0A380G4B3_STAIN|nr:hypothetical protein [Staphylococcus intermedius]PCF64351.1 hypothetical protein B5C04_10325 [Staphylococcus intermedius]PCF79067.1 hypothetical protein B4W74_10675 [Staphylococcus intermedius]PCF80040.1 hypothetical protein B4W70_10315 [Staphylococcus intermedius]PCF89299.1 hypothetical protein B4W75_00230 [Staphylococcus intermedius]PNZ53112.1 hypothetical protein CD138_05180 [Staphylococcus intermedius NCTC 11048]
MKSKISYVLIPLAPVEFIAMYIDYHLHSLLGYTPYIIISVLISYPIFKNGLKNSYTLVISRVIGMLISFLCVHLFINTYHSASYFKPFTADFYSILLGIISFIVVALCYFVMWGFSSKNR